MHVKVRYVGGMRNVHGIEPEKQKSKEIKKKIRMKLAYKVVVVVIQ